MDELESSIDRRKQSIVTVTEKLSKLRQENIRLMKINELKRERKKVKDLENDLLKQLEIEMKQLEEQKEMLDVINGMLILNDLILFIYANVST